MQIKEDLKKIVGAENVSDDPEALLSYSKDQSLSKSRTPNYIARPKNTDEVQQVIKLANKNGIPVVPCSSGIHFYGNTIPSLGGIILDLRRMDKILDFDMYNKMVRVEPGVTWGQLQSEMAKHDMMALSPVAAPPPKVGSNQPPGKGTHAHTQV